MASIDTEEGCAAVQRIIERDFRPRPGRADAIAPNGKPYIAIRTKPAETPVEALQDLGGRFRALIVEYQGDTVWWRIKPCLEQDEVSKCWTAKARLALGHAITERLEFMPDDEHRAAYPDDGRTDAHPPVAAQGGLPRWKCHKVVEAAKIRGVVFNPEPVLVLDRGIRIPVPPEPWGRMNKMVPRIGDGGEWTGLVGGYYVRYADGFESWGPSKSFEDGYTKVET